MILTSRPCFLKMPASLATQRTDDEPALGEMYAKFNRSWAWECEIMLPNNTVAKIIETSRRICRFPFPRFMTAPALTVRSRACWAVRLDRPGIEESAARAFRRSVRWLCRKRHRHCLNVDHW